MKKIRMILSFVMIIAIIVCALTVYERINVSNNDDMVEIIIPEGTSTTGIYEILKDNGLVKTKIGFLVNLKLSPYDKKLRYGTFNLSKSMSVREIIKELATGGKTQDTFTLTIPEGYSLEMIAQKLDDINIVSKKDFYDALGDNYDYGFLNEIPKKDYKYALQGFLFPSTYEFFVSATAHDIINTLLGEFEKQYSSIENNSGLSMYDTITLASLIEREAKLHSERYTISGVINNRLKIDMLLQIDATVVYAISDGMYNVDKVLYKDLENKSPYNTYKYTGLPVGPICNPGLESIKAAINPEKHNYLYYHTDETKKDGSHIFTENFSDHTNTQ